MFDWIRNYRLAVAAERDRKAKIKAAWVAECRTLNAAGICARCKKRPVSELSDLQLGTVYNFDYCDPCWDHIGAMSMC